MFCRTVYYICYDVFHGKNHHIEHLLHVPDILDSTTTNNNIVVVFNTNSNKVQCVANHGSNKYISRYRIKMYHCRQCAFRSTTYKSLYTSSLNYTTVIKIFDKPDCQVV